MDNSKNHILIVDDDNRIRDLLKDYLSENKYIVSTAENADQAKERLKYWNSLSWNEKVMIILFLLVIWFGWGQFQI